MTRVRPATEQEQREIKALSLEILASHHGATTSPRYLDALAYLFVCGCMAHGYTSAEIAEVLADVQRSLVSRLD